MSGRIPVPGLKALRQGRHRAPLPHVLGRRRPSRMIVIIIMIIMIITTTFNIMIRIVNNSNHNNNRSAGRSRPGHGGWSGALPEEVGSPCRGVSSQVSCRFSSRLCSSADSGTLMAGP